MNDFDFSLESSAWASWLASVSGTRVADKSTPRVDHAPSPPDLDSIVELPSQVTNIRSRPLSDRQWESATDRFVFRGAIVSGIVTVSSVVIYLAMTTLHGLWITLF